MKLLRSFLLKNLFFSFFTSGLLFALSSCNMVTSESDSLVSPEPPTTSNFPQKPEVQIPPTHQTIILEKIPNSLVPGELAPDFDLAITLPRESSVPLMATSGQGHPLSLQVTSSNESVAYFENGQLVAGQPGLAVLSIQATEENYKDLSIQVVVPAKVNLLTPAGEGWWYQKIEADNNILPEDKTTMLELYKLILQKPGTVFVPGLASIIPVPKPLSVAQLLTVYWAVKLDYPELFWLKSTCTFHWDGTMKCFALGIETVFSSLEEYNTMVTTMETAVNTFITEVMPVIKTSDTRKTLYFIYEKLAEIEYDHSVKSDILAGKNWKIHSSYGALIERKCVCDGYSSAFAYIVKKLQNDSFLDNVYVSMVVGNPPAPTSGPGHAWNMVRIGEQWSELDITFGKEQDLQKNFLQTNWDRAFAQQHNLNSGFKFISDYIPYAQERTNLYFKK